MRLRNALGVVLAVLLCVGLVTGVVAPAAASELDNRPTVTYPSSDTLTLMDGTGMTIPSGGTNYAHFSGNTLVIADNTAAGKGFASVYQPVDLAINDLAFTYQLTTAGWYSTASGNDYGSAFILFNDPTFAPHIDNDYGMLAIYKNRSNTSADTRAVANSLAVEFDNYVSENSADSAIASNTGSHIAITHPGESVTAPVQHYALSQLTTPYSNNATNTARITWTLTDPGPTDALTGNVYTYYQGATSAAGSPTHTGSKTYTYAQMVAVFGGTSTVQMAMSGSTAWIINRRQTLSFPAVYPYTTTYLSTRADGTRTTTPVRVLTADSGSLPAGPADVGPLPAAPTGYEVVAGQSTDVTISATATNAYTYYYRDLAPTISGATAATVEAGAAFDPRAGVTATDGVDGTLTAAMTVSGTVDAATPGSYTLTYTVTDSIGNTTTVTRVVTVVDTTPPEMVDVDPLAETATTVTGTAEPGASITVTLRDGTTLTTTAGSDGAWSVTTPAPLMGGTTVTVTATDAAGNTSDPTVVVIR